MRNVPKNYRDENYADPLPREYCLVCCDPIYEGDACYEVDEGVVHDNCVGGYVNDFVSTEELIEALRLEKKVWCTDL